MMGLRTLFYLGVLVSVGLYYARRYTRATMCTLTDRVDGKIVLITGANIGLGLETAVELATRGGIIHMTCRDENRCRIAREVVLERSGASESYVITHLLDLASLRSVLAFTDRFRASVERLDILINNAGMMVIPYSETVDGFEMHIGVNHLGHFLLTNRLVDLLVKGISPRIIILSSTIHRLASINTTDFNLKGSDYGPWAAYAQSKLANILHAKLLAQRLRDANVTAVSIHPGLVVTNFGRNIPRMLQVLAGFASAMWLKTPLEGAQTQICCAVNPQLAQFNGQYFSDCAPTESANIEVHNDSLAQLLWDQSERAVNQKLEKLT